MAQEAYEGKIDLLEDDPDTVDAMINYFYRLEYGLGWINLSRISEDEAAETATPEAATDSTRQSPARPMLVAHAKVYMLADKYLISGLKALALRKFTTSVCNCFDANDFLHAMQEIYSSTSDNEDGLRAVIVSTLYKHRYLLDQKEVQAVLKDFGSVTYDLVMFIHKQVEQ